MCIRDRAQKGRLRFGTIDTWLAYSLTDGAAYVTDVTNASRTMLFDIRKLRWDETLCRELGVPLSALPRVVESGEIVGMCSADVLGEEIPIAAMAGDQHAALFGQCCFQTGMAKNTYGTGCFVLMNTGEKPVFSQEGLLTTIGWRLRGRTTYALEGSAFNAGSAIQWLRDELEIIRTPQEADQLAETVEDAGGVSFVPAFTDVYKRQGHRNALNGGVVPDGVQVRLEGNAQLFRRGLAPLFVIVPQAAELCLGVVLNGGGVLHRVHMPRADDCDFHRVIPPGNRLDFFQKAENFCEIGFFLQLITTGGKKQEGGTKTKVFSFPERGRKKGRREKRARPF